MGYPIRTQADSLSIAGWNIAANAHSITTAVERKIAEGIAPIDADIFGLTEVKDRKHGTITLTGANAMIRLDLSDQEADTLNELLQNSLANLSYEIADTDLKDFRDSLKAKRDMLQKIADSLAVGRN